MRASSKGTVLSSGARSELEPESRLLATAAAPPPHPDNGPPLLPSTCRCPRCTRKPRHQWPSLMPKFTLFVLSSLSPTRPWTPEGRDCWRICPQSAAQGQHRAGGRRSLGIKPSPFAGSTSRSRPAASFVPGEGGSGITQSWVFCVLPSARASAPGGRPW